jgi:hypothetical protein
MLGMKIMYHYDTRYHIFTGVQTRAADVARYVTRIACADVCGKRILLANAYKR